MAQNYIYVKYLGGLTWEGSMVFSNCLIIYLQQTIDEVENLIKKHEAFEKAAAAQEERFAALERLTTVSRSLF